MFGIGASATVAAWTDTEQATGFFAAGEFAIEATVDGTWSNTREMTFDAAAMYPGAIVYAPVLIRTTPSTTVGGELTVNGENASGDVVVDVLEYRTVVQTVESETPACNADSFSGSPEFVFGAADNWVAMTAREAASSQEVAAAGSSTVAYCFEVRLPSDAPDSSQGTTAEHTWTWDAVSATAGS